ncbi:glycosyltransferase family 2 protein [Sphingopyxis sp. 550A]
MAASPRFSVVIPLFNKGSHIGSTLQSVLGQQFEDYEVIVVDDGSTDAGPDVVRGLTSDRVRMITQQNSGVSAARNRGISEAKGQYVAFLDADDTWTSQHLKELNRLIISYPERGLYSCAHAVVRNGVKYRKRQPEAPDFVADAAGFFAEYSRSFSLVNSSTACVARDILSGIDRFPENVKKGEDVIIWIQAAFAGGIAYSTALGACVNEDAENRSDRNPSREIPFFVAWLDRQLQERRIAADTAPQARKFLYRAALFNAAGCALRGDTFCLNLYRELDIAKSFALWLPLRLLSIIPEPVLRIMQRRRHHQFA